MTAMLLIKLMGYIDSNYIAPGPFSVYKTSVIKNLGGFDETNLTEDQEIAYRVQKKHLKIRQCPTAEVYTVAPGSIRTLYRQRNRWFKGTLQNLFKYKSLNNRNLRQEYLARLKEPVIISTQFLLRVSPPLVIITLVLK